MNATEYGIFTDEGCIERQLWNPTDAEVAQARWIEAGEEATVRVMAGCDDECAEGSCHCMTEENEDGDEVIMTPSGSCPVHGEEVEEVPDSDDKIAMATKSARNLRIAAWGY